MGRRSRCATRPPGRAGSAAPGLEFCASCAQIRAQPKEGPPDMTRPDPSAPRAQFPQARPRRLRRTATLRRMVRETRLAADSFIYPVFVVPGADVKEEIASMPGVYHQSVDRVVEDAREVADLGIPALLLFGLPHTKDWEGSEAWAADGIVQQALRAIRRAAPSL